MYTAKIKSKDDTQGVIKMTVDFTNGTDTFTETCVPQNKEGFTFWVKSRLEAFNSSETLQTEYKVDDVVDVSDTVVTPPVLTQEEIDRNTWLEKYAKWVRIKTTVVDTGIVPISNTKIASMLQNLKDTLKAEYIDYI